MGSAAVAEKELLKEKIALCKKYKMKAADIAKLLEVDAARVNALDDLGNGIATHEVCWDEGRDLLVSDIDNAKITFELWANDATAKVATWSSRLLGQPGKPKGDMLLGKKEFTLSNLASGTSPTYCNSIHLSQCDALLKVRLELRQLGEPTNDPQRSFADPSSR